MNIIIFKLLNIILSLYYKLYPSKPFEDYYFVHGHHGYYSKIIICSYKKGVIFTFDWFNKCKCSACDKIFKEI